jgi:hypothetical protein
MVSDSYAGELENFERELASLWRTLFLPGN